jgi:hypothetical protein
MAENGVWDVTCGANGWSIIKRSGTDPPPGPSHVPLAVGNQRCFTESNFPGHADVGAQDVSLGVAIACGQVPKTMNAQSPHWTPPQQLYGRKWGWVQDELRRRVEDRMRHGCGRDKRSRPVGRG